MFKNIYESHFLGKHLHLADRKLIAYGYGNGFLRLVRYFQTLLAFAVLEALKYKGSAQFSRQVVCTPPRNVRRGTAA